MGGSNNTALDSVLVRMAEASRPFALKNIRDGWPQLNNLRFAYKVARDSYPDLAQRLMHAKEALKFEPNTANGRVLFAVWKEICRRVREERT